MHEELTGQSGAPSSPTAPALDTSPDNEMPPKSSTIADAFERRLQQERERVANDPENYSDFDDNHEKRQHFRRLIDPGIMRPNPRHIALKSLQTLLTLAENILQHPGDAKYRRFKPTNHKIKTTLVDPKGTLEYAVELGFRPEVENFQPYYVFHERRMNDLRVGAAIIKEVLESELTKEERLDRARKEEKAVSEAAKEKVKQAFMDDRKSVALQARRDQATRQASTRGTSVPHSSPSPPLFMPGSGHALTEVANPGSPPAYDT